MFYEEGMLNRMLADSRNIESKRLLYDLPPKIKQEKTCTIDSERCWAEF